MFQDALNHIMLIKLCACAMVLTKPSLARLKDSLCMWQNLLDQLVA